MGEKVRRRAALELVAEAYFTTDVEAESGDGESGQVQPIARNATEDDSGSKASTRLEVPFLF